MTTIDKSLPLDPWTASSLLQKGIRRGETEFAQWAASELHRQRGASIWRRLVLIAFEDVGIGDPALVERVTAVSTDRNARASLGSDINVISQLVADLAAAPKDRSTDYLICTAMSSLAAPNEKAVLSGVSTQEMVTFAATRSNCMVSRATATWYALGIDGSGRIGKGNGNFPMLMKAFVEEGLPIELALAVDVATRLTREPITLMLPILLSVLRAERVSATVVETSVPPVRLHQGIPLYAFDKHTSPGKRAIGVFVTENDRVAKIIAEYAPDFRARDIAAIAAFYADAAPVSRRLAWSGSRDLESLGLDTDMRDVGCPPLGILPIAEVVREELDHLNEIRARMLGKVSPDRQGALPLGEKA